MEKVKKIPFFIKGIIIVGMIAVMVCLAAAGLKVMEERQQKPRVLKAMVSLLENLADKKYSLDSSYQMLKGGKLVYSGELMLEHIDENLFEERYRFFIPYINHTALSYTFCKDEKERKAEVSLNAALHGTRALSLDGYLDEKECIVYFPSFHNSHLSFSPENIKEQYQGSLLYTVLGDMSFLPEENIAEYIFHGKEVIGGHTDKFEAKLKEGLEFFKELYQEIIVEKTEKKEEILWNGGYESCTAYYMAVPAELVYRFMTLAGIDNKVLPIEEKELSFFIYLDSKKRLLKLETEVTLLVDKQKVPLSVVFYPKGVENPWDSVVMELDITIENIMYGFYVVGNNEFLEGKRVFHSYISMTQPYVMELFDMDIAFEQETGDISIDFACKAPMLSMDGICKMEPLSGQINKPEEEAVKLFELHFLEMIRFSNGLNWNFFKKQE